MFQPLNPLTVPIAHTNLIEASAGTGKTWNIAALFTRLIVLEHYRVDKILVVTFTKAATAELKTRLRARLDEALAILKKTPYAAENLDLLEQNCWINGKFEPFRFDLLQQALNQESQARLELRLKAAISEFDNAAIYTIHGFCQRVLQDFAFLCQVPFDIQLDEQSADNQYLTAAQDFWRTQVAPNPQLAALVYRYKLTPQNQLAALKSFLSRPYLPFRQPETPSLPYAMMLNEFHDIFQKTIAQLPEIETQFWKLFDTKLSGRFFKRPTFEKKFIKLNETVNATPADILKILQSEDSKTKNLYNPFTHENFSEKLLSKENISTEETEIFKILCQLYEISENMIANEKFVLHQLAQDFATYLRTQRRELKKHSPQRVFDDLLLDVYAALMENPEYAQTLAQSLAQNWQVALIDEFQDTDPLQYAIFRTAFAGTNTPLFLVGDPKQAIYSFRGADIFAYLQAVQDSQQHYTLDTNQRSHRLLINSIGKFFERNQPFALPEIDYVNVNARRDTPDLSPAGRAVQVRWLPNADGLNTDALVRESAAICAAQIADLLAQSFSGNLKIKDKPLHAGQIAVLVRARKDGAIMQRELKKRNIQSVLLSRESVFAEAEALAVAALLEFMIQPQKTGLLRFVLSGCLFEYDSAALHDLNVHENQLLAWIDSANTAHEIWLQDGIYAALQAFFAQHGVETRLLTQNQERTLTNLHQIMELLAQEDELSHTPTSLLQWLNREIQAASKQKNSHDHHILRLESDEQLVKIVTMHAAKGLQYPIVFCPFLWKASEVSTRTDWHISHERGFAEIISKTQYKQSDDDRENIKLAHLSEDLRLLYVALTRAEERLYLYVSHFQTSEKSDKSNKNQEDNLDLKYKNALAYLLNADEKLTKNATAYEAHWREFVANQTLGETDIEFVVHDDLAFSGSLQTENPPPKPIFHATEFAPRRFQFVQHASFTSLSRQTERAAAELSPILDTDELAMVVPSAPPPDGDSIHAFPQGAAAGVCLHSVLEKLHFRQPASEQIDLINEKLIYHGFDPEMWREAVVQMCDFARETPLLPRVNLAALNQRNTLSEMNFLLHTDDFRLADIQAWLATQDLPDEIIRATRNLAFRDVCGYLNGAIDLVAHTQGKTLIVDYKSNYLGNSAAAYTPNAMDAAMAEHHYYLQAFIYAIAVARYLQSRGVLPEMVSVRYLFLRGLDGISANGVWAWDIRTADLARWL